MRIEATIIIDRDAAAVFDFTAARHLENHPRWDPAVTRMTSLTLGPFGIGSTFQIHRRTAGRSEVREFTVSEWVPSSRFAITASEPGSHISLAQRLEPAGLQATRVALVGDAQIGGVRGLLAPLFRGRLQRDLQANLVRIKDMMEAA